MKKRIKLQGREVAYALRKSARARRMRLAVYCDGAVVVTMPHDLPMPSVQRYLSDKAEWLFSKLAFFARFQGQPLARRSRADYLRYREQAKELIEERVAQLNRCYDFSYNVVVIKNQKTRWGSCSKRGNLNFNYKVLFLPDRVRDYVIVHELCHLKEFSHSRKFWGLVAKSFPDYLEIRRTLKGGGMGFR